MDKFEKEKLHQFLPNTFKGLSKAYIIKCIFDEKIQKEWRPGVGDIIVGETGNVFVISAKEELHQDLGGTRYYYGGSMCSRDGSNFMRSTMCYTMNESGKWYTWADVSDIGKFGIIEKENYYHTSYKNYRYVPYPHELTNV